MSAERKRFSDGRGWPRGEAETATTTTAALTVSLRYRLLAVGGATMAVRIFPKETAAVRAVPPAWFWRGPWVLGSSPGRKAAP